MKKNIVDRVADITSAAEDVVDELTNAAGTIVTKATPLIAPLASGVTVLFACYDGIGRMIANMIAYPYIVSFTVGFFLAMAIEGIGFSSQHTRDRSERLKATRGQALDYVNAGSLVTQSFLLTLAVILFLESIPGAVAWYKGELSASDMAFRFGLLVLPFFSRIGARIFSISTLLDAIEGAQESRRAKRLQAQREKTAHEAEMMLLKRKAELEVAQMEATAQRKIEGRSQYRAKSQPDIAQNKAPVLNSVSDQNRDITPILSSESAVENDPILNHDQSTILTPAEKMREGKQRKIDQRRKDLLEIIKQQELGIGALATSLDVSENTIRNDLEALQGAGHQMSINGVVKLNQ